MLINGKPKAACQTPVDHLLQPVCLEPLSKFPVLRDLVVDRFQTHKDCQRLQVWKELDGYHNTNEHRNSYSLDSSFAEAARCVSCGACLEACPQYHEGSCFVGPMVLLRAYPHLLNARSHEHKQAMLKALAAEGGVFACCNAQNCQRVCPQKINITETIGLLKRAVLKGTVKRFLG
jgi:succinate dehydrogenase / fumarate reductase iron-sulfur subunit